MVGRNVLCYRLMSTTNRNHPISWREGRRRRAWELHQMGWTQQHIAQALGVSQGAVSQWLKRATLHGVGDGEQALCTLHRAGRPALLAPDQLAQLVGLLAQGAEAFGFRGA